MAKSLGTLNRGNLSLEGVVREIRVNLLECKVCFEKFSNQQRERRPHNLSCGHVLCLECIMALSHPLLRKLECPFCRQLCSSEATSHCQVLCDLQELLSCPTPSTPPLLDRRELGLAQRQRSAALHHCRTFGGWGTLINPTGIAVLGSSGTIVVVHDGHKKVAVFSPKGKKLHSFGRRQGASGRVCYPVDVAVTLSGYVVVTDAADAAVKVFTSRGTEVLTIQDDFLLPWGVDTDSTGHILVSDVQAGTLSQIKVDYGHAVLLEHRKAVTDLQHPKAVACCQLNGNIAVMEHLSDERIRNHQHSRLQVFTKDFHVLYQTDSFSLALQSTVILNMSAVAFDRDGDVLVIDSNQGMIWSLGKLHSDPVLTPLVGDHLIQAVGLVAMNNMLCILDSGDHAVKIYTA